MADFANPVPSLRAVSRRLTQARAIVGLAAFIVLFCVLIFVVETLLLLGVPESILVAMIMAFALAVPALASISTRTVSLSEFAVAGRQLGPAESTMAASAGLFGAVFMIGLTAAFFRSEAEMTALALGLAGGVLMSGVLFAPYLRRAARQSIGDFLAARFGGRGVSAVAGLIVIAALFPMLIAELSLAGMVGNWTVGAGKSSFIVVAAILMLIPPLLGGMRGVTVTAVLQFMLVLAALAFASIGISKAATGYTLPLAGYVTAAANLGATIYGTGSTQLTSASAWSFAGLGLCVTLGIAVLPTLLMRTSVTRSTQAARSSIARTILFVVLFSLAAVSMAAIAKWTVEESPVQSGSIAELLAQPWIVDWVARGEALVTLCGAPASEAGITCAGPLKSGDVAIAPDIALLAAPQIAGLPPIFTVLTAAGCLTAAIAAGSLLLFGIGRAFGHDILFRAIAPRMPASRRLLTQRLALIVVTILAADVAIDPPAGYLNMALIALSFAASGLFPALLAAIWWRRANRFGVLAGMLAGFVIAAYLAAGEIHDPRLFAWLEPAGLHHLARYLGAQKAALIAIPAGLAVTVIVSLATRASNAAQLSFAEALFVARDMSADDDTE